MLTWSVWRSSALFKNYQYGQLDHDLLSTSKTIHLHFTDCLKGISMWEDSPTLWANNYTVNTAFFFLAITLAYWHSRSIRGRACSLMQRNLDIYVFVCHTILVRIVWTTAFMMRTAVQASVFGPHHHSGEFECKYGSVLVIFVFFFRQWHLFHRRFNGHHYL